MIPKDGGGAFPRGCNDSQGISVRDYFAAKAMPTLLQLCRDDSLQQVMTYPEHVALKAYEVADAMLKEREL